ncbi:MarR family winged helix-turn-helix transcriptional regulator [Paraburkholderia terrae]|jgi:DNA-binding MarR family transcriptional regulator|uniref:MarR family transcriptional regulator n=1 Tax=Paraburkholderia terrae TaxID=311230 RepID=A0A2I8EZZ9_9BURK|nr:MarR family transcriptional regulator [Paraburkholderia terrae]AUT65038.1 MarR family transcriptional regulator [Paraburkholderia terrae]
MTTSKRETDLGLDSYLSFAVYSANLAFGKAYKPMLDQLGLTYTQYLTLIALSEQDQQTVGNLGERLYLTSSTLTPILKKLESKGFVQRQRHVADERQVLVALSRSGLRLCEKAQSLDIVESAGMKANEIAVALRAITMLRDALVKSGRRD